MKRGLLCILSALLLMGMLFRVGYQVEIRGEVLPGVYAPADVRQSAADARRAAEEICRETEEAPFRLLPVLCARHTPMDRAALTRTLLGAYEGVEAMYAVYAGETCIGLTADPGLPGTIYDERLAAQAMTGVRPSRSVTRKRVFTYPEAATGVMELSRAMGEAALY